MRFVSDGASSGRRWRMCRIVVLLSACAAPPPPAPPLPPEPQPPLRELVEFQFRGRVEEVRSGSASVRSAIQPGAEILGAFRWPSDARTMGTGTPSQLAIYLARGEDVGQELRIAGLEFCTYDQRRSSTVTLRQSAAEGSRGDQLVVAQDCAQPFELDEGSTYVEGIVTLTFATPTFTPPLELPADLSYAALRSAEVVVVAYPTERSVPPVPLISLRTGGELYRIRGTLETLSRAPLP